RVLAAVSGTLLVIVASNWLVIAGQLGRMLGLTPLQSALKLGGHHAWTLAQLANGPLELAMAALAVLVAAIASRQPRPAAATRAKAPCQPGAPGCVPPAETTPPVRPLPAPARSRYARPVSHDADAPPRKHPPDIQDAGPDQAYASLEAFLADVGARAY